MKYPQFKKATKETLTYKILELFQIIQEQYLFIKIDNTPDYDITEFQREIDSTYYFRNSWGFEEKFDVLLSAEFGKAAIFHSENINDIIKDFKLDHLKYYPFIEIVTAAYKIDKTELYMHSFEPNLENYDLHELRINGIDNFEKLLWYEGSFFGDSWSIDPIDFELIVRTHLTGIKIHESFPFYMQLLGEAFLLQKENRFKLSYFLTYSALENFVNTILDSHLVEDRFSDKFKELFKLHLPDHSRNQIYCSLVGELEVFTSIRNTIVHGKEQIEVDYTLSDSFLSYVLIFVMLYEWKDESFQSLYNRIYLVHN